MKPTEILMNEHRVIEQVLACLEKMANLCEREGRLESGPARDAVAFFRAFADRCHHGKEEDQLFPLVESRGFSAEAGPTAVMRSEHVRGRELVGRIELAIEGAGKGRAEDVRAFVGNARAFLSLLREHIQKEDHVLFPMADQVLADEDQKTLLRRFEAVEHEDLGDGDHERYRRIADALADRFDVPRAAAREGGGTTSGAR